MYQNAGRSIKSVVSVLVTVGYTLSIIGALVIMIIGAVNGEENAGIVVLSMIGAIIVGGLGCLSTWLSGLWLYAYGEITDRLISIDERLADLDESADQEDEPWSDKVEEDHSTRVQYCPQCGARNDANSLFCSTCGNALM